MSAAGLVLLCVLLCVALVAAPIPSSELGDPNSPRARALRMSELRLASTLTALAVFILLTLYVLGRGGGLDAIAILAGLVGLALMVIHPWIAVRFILIPLGQVRLVHTISSLGGYPWLRDPTGGAALAATLALMRRSHASESEIEWIERQIQGRPLRGAGLAASGLLAACRGDTETARALLRSVEAFDSERCPLTAWRIALEWQMADAASSGDWQAVKRLVQHGPQPSRTAVFLALVARRLTGEWVTDQKLVRAWIRAPHRLDNLRLLQRALHNNEDITDTPPLHPLVDLSEVAANGGASPQIAAQALMVGFVQNPRAGVPEDRFFRLVDTWEQALASTSLHTHLSRRVLALQANHSAEELLEQLREQLSDDLAALARAHDLAIGEATGPSGSLRELCVRKFRELLLLEVESTASALASRLQKLEAQDFAHNFEVVTHWRSFLAAREIYEHAAKLGGESLRRMAFPKLEKQLNRLALLALSRFDERGFADGIFRFLLWEAEAQHNEVSAAAYRHNLAAGF